MRFYWARTPIQVQHQADYCRRSIKEEEQPSRGQQQEDMEEAEREASMPMTSMPVTHTSG